MTNSDYAPKAYMSVSFHDYDESGNSTRNIQFNLNGDDVHFIQNNLRTMRDFLRAVGFHYVDELCVMGEENETITHTSEDY